jgi:hypothetical protein
MRMKKRVLLGFLSSFVLFAQAGCDSRPDRAMAVGGSAGSAPVLTCVRSSDCVNQVCSPDGRCINCYDARDCRANQQCVAEQCMDEGGSGAASTGGSTPGSGAVGTGGNVSVGNQCGGAQVLFVIQRSGIMFEEPSEDQSYWSMVKEAITGADGAVVSFGDRLDLGAAFFVRLQYEEDMTCPIVSSSMPQTGALTPLQDLFTGNESEYAQLADDQAKMDAPVPEAITAAAALLSGAARHIVLISSAVPDSCTLADSNCTVDLAIKAVQDARSQGVTTHVIGLGDTGNLDSSEDDDGYGTYLRQLANAGAGEPVAISGAFDEQCADEDATASYAESDGTAQAHRAESAADIRTALQQILSSVCP